MRIIGVIAMLNIGWCVTSPKPAPNNSAAKAAAHPPAAQQQPVQADHGNPVQDP